MVDDLVALRCRPAAEGQSGPASGAQFGAIGAVCCLGSFLAAASETPSPWRSGSLRVCAVRRRGGSTIGHVCPGVCASESASRARSPQYRHVPSRQGQAGAYHGAPAGPGSIVSQVTTAQAPRKTARLAAYELARVAASSRRLLASTKAGRLTCLICNMTCCCVGPPEWTDVQQLHGRRRGDADPKIRLAFLEPPALRALLHAAPEPERRRPGDRRRPLAESPYEAPGTSCERT